MIFVRICGECRQSHDFFAIVAHEIFMPSADLHIRVADFGSCSTSKPSSLRSEFRSKWPCASSLGDIDHESCAQNPRLAVSIHYQRQAGPKRALRVPLRGDRDTLFRPFAPRLRFPTANRSYERACGGTGVRPPLQAKARAPHPTATNSQLPEFAPAREQRNGLTIQQTNQRPQ